MKHGFTLIELLVVVLIIGILASVALPQYQAAVEKSRLASVMQNVRHGKEIMELYYLANGEYPATLEDSGFQIPGCQYSESKMVVYCKNHYYHYLGPVLAGVVQRSDSRYTSVYEMGLDWSPKKGYIACRAIKTSLAAQRACKSMGGTQIIGAGWIYYKLPESRN